MTDKEYLELYRNSPTTAQNMLFEEYVGYVYSIVFNKLRSCAGHEDIEECVGDIFFSVYQNYEINKSFDGDLKGFIGTIAARKAVSKFRSITLHNGRTTSMEDEVFEIADDENIEENAEKSELRKTLLDVIRSLGEPDSTIVLQKFYFNESSAKIAEKLSMTSAAVRVRCGRAIKKMRKLLEAQGITLKEGY
ncbi:MAG: sigma-70 family RNA polymerase sigma factor [Ruminococcus sp.]|nr:sigma-70 family RNA polymerase sigma factor [Ruminococcus sp.]